jgi:hypothetical protein
MILIIIIDIKASIKLLVSGIRFNENEAKLSLTDSN